MIMRFAVHSEKRHETVAQKLVDHASMLSFDHFHHCLQKFVEEADRLMRFQICSPCGERSNIDEHDGDFLFDAAKPRVAREDSLRGFPAHVQTKCFSQLLLLS